MSRLSRSFGIRITTTLLVGAVLTGCGGGGGSGSRTNPRVNDPTPPPSSNVVSTTAYVASAPHAGVLRRCTYAGDATEQCRLGTLPFLGTESNDPGIDDVLRRTLVSHTWMGRNLGQVLAELPPDVLPLFRSITAVVIASDVRPAYYDPNTGAIYLDPDFLWLTVAERDTVSTDPDPRSAFGLDLRFQMPWRYVRDNQRLTVFLNPDGSRNVDQLREIMGYLLYHELAHAADFMPPDRLPAVSADDTVLQALSRDPPLSTAFEASLPLESQQLRALASVSFQGTPSTATQRVVEPEDLVSEFVDDGAVQYYSYTSQYEDFATLFESAMMKWHFGYDKDTAITDRPASGNVDDAVVVWGTRGRLGEKPVFDRVRGAGQRIYPGDLATFEAFLDDEPAPQRMRAGDTWAANLVLATMATSESTASPGHARRVADYFLERVRIR